MEYEWDCGHSDRSASKPALNGDKSTTEGLKANELNSCTVISDIFNINLGPDPTQKTVEGDLPVCAFEFGAFQADCKHFQLRRGCQMF
jgi:hypothetical protein